MYLCLQLDPSFSMCQKPSQYGGIWGIIFWGGQCSGFGVAVMEKVCQLTFSLLPSSLACSFLSWFLG